MNVNVDAEAIKAMQSFSVAEWIAIGAIAIVLFFLFFNLNKIIDARLLKRKEENEKLEIENKALMNSIKETQNRIEEVLTIGNQERVTRQNEVNKRFDSIDSRIEDLYSITADQEELINTVSQGTLENMLFNDKISMFRRLKSFRRLIAIKANGRVKKKGLELILQNKETWLDVMDLKMDLEIIDQVYYDSVLAEINRRIFDGVI